ncbi:MAG TPA: hypothetical protein VK698_39360 [Kofleriaceae bacterium]|nr:hypothetical protein [Kofleriaceae bacterium]
MKEIYERSKRGAKQLERDVRIGTVLYTVVDVAQNYAPWEDAQLYSRCVVTFRSRVTGNLMISGSMSVIGLALREGPVYTEKPKGLRNLAKPGRQVSGPLPDGYEGVLDEAELKGLEKRVRNGSDPRKRRRLGGWRV